MYVRSVVGFCTYYLLHLLLLTAACRAGPACARRHRQAANCIQLCGSKWGWPGSVMGTDPWGAVMSPGTSDLEGVLSEACGDSASLANQNSNASVATSTSDIVYSVQSTASSLVSVPSSAASYNGTTLLISSSSSFSSSSVLETSSVESYTTLPSTYISEDPSSSSPTVFATPQTTSTSPPAVTSASSSSTPNAPTYSSSQSSSSTSAASAASVAPAAQSTSDSSSDTSSSDEEQYLSDHNSFRAQHGADPLTWNNTLADKAQQWANNCVFQHSGGSLGPFGENLAAGTGSSYGIAAGIQSWTNEASQYDPSNPVASHFTQVVWKNSLQLGCAEAQCNGIFAASFGLATFIVCEYYPAGNVLGEFAENVQV